MYMTKRKKRKLTLTMISFFEIYKDENYRKFY